MKKLLKENILPNFDPVMEFDEWRERYLYRLEVEDILKLNNASLFKLFTMHHTFHKKYWTLKDAVTYILQNVSEFGFSEL